MKYILMMVLLILPVQAHADWSNAGLHPMMAPNFSPNHGQPAQHEIHVNVPRPVEQHSMPVVNHTPSVRRDQPVNHYQASERHVSAMPGYFHRDANYYGHDRVIFPYAEVDLPFIVPNGFEAVMVDGQTYYYNEGIFYQEVGNQLAAIPPVLGAVVDYIPQDYQIVMADGTHYLFTGGVYYQRVDQGFEVVEGPGQDQE